MKPTELISNLKFRRLAVVSLIGIVALVVISSFQFSSLRFDYDIEKFFATDDPQLETYEDFKGAFENENDYLLLGIKNGSGVFEYDFLTKVDQLVDSLEALKFIEKVYSPTNTSHSVKAAFVGQIKAPLIHLDDKERLEKDKQLAYEQVDFTRSFFSDDTTSINLLLKTAHIDQKSKTSGELEKVENLVKSKAFDNWHLSGRAKTQEFYMREMRSEMGLFLGCSLLIIIITFFLILKNRWYVLFAVSSLSASLILTFGFIGWIEYPINLMIILLPAITLITGTSSAIHYLTKLSQLANKHCRVKTIQLALKETGVPIFLNSFTTAIGLATLWFIPVEPIQYFGVLTAFAIMLTFIVTIVLISACYMIAPVRKFSAIEFPTRKKRKKENAKTTLKPFSWRVATFVLIISGTWLVMTQLEVNNYFLDDLNDRSALKKDLSFFESNFNGIRPFEVLATIHDDSKLESEEVIQELDELTQFLEKTYELKSTISPLSILKGLNQSWHGGNPEYYALPASSKKRMKLLRFIDEKQLWNKFMPTRNGRTLRISARSKDLGSHVLEQKNSELAEFKQELKHIDVELTGASYLMDRANSSISRFLLIGIALAVLTSTLCIFFLTKSISLSLVSLIPNTVPLLFAGFLMWLFGIPLKIGTVMIFTIIYGLAVDDTMHFLHEYKKHRKTESALAAVQASYRNLKTPMMTTTLILSFGFFVFGFSQFGSISAMGMLIGSSLFIALFADFVILPAFLIFGKNKEDGLKDVHAEQELSEAELA